MFGRIKSTKWMLAVVTSLLLLSGCGKATAPAPANNATPKTTAPTTSEQHTEDTGEATTKIVKITSKKEVEVPTHPQRLIVSGFAYGDIIPFELMDREIILEGWVDLENKSKEWREAWDHTTVNTTQFESFSDLEGITTLDPDIIIGTTGQLSSDVERDLEKITSTVLYEQENIDRVNYTMDDRMRILGDLFGMPEKAEELIKSFNEKVASVIEAIADEGLADKKIVFVHGLENGTPIIATDINQSLTYKVLGMSAPAKVDQEMLFHDDLPDDLFSNHVKIVSLEVLPEYLMDADIIVYRFVEDDEESIAAKTSSIEVWKNIPAVKKGNVLYISYTNPLFGFSYADYMVALNTFVDLLKQLPIAKN